MKKLLLIHILTALAAISAVGQEKAVIKFSAANVRVKPSDSASLDTQELMGTVVDVLERDGQWARIHCPQPYEGWVDTMGLAPLDGTLEEYESAPKYICIEMISRVLSAPVPEALPICDLVAGDLMRRGGDRTGGYVSVVLPGGVRGWVRSDDVMDMDEWERTCKGMSPAQKCAAVINFARQQMGVPYQWGGMTPKGMDCSGLVRLCYLMCGVSLPRDAWQQASAGRRIELARADDGNWDLSSLRPGDLLFFARAATADRPARVVHVGIYLGDNHFIHASHMVRINSLRLGEHDSYENERMLHCACRIVE